MLFQYLETGFRSPSTYRTELVNRSAEADKHLKANCPGAKFKSIHLLNNNKLVHFRGGILPTRVPQSLTGRELEKGDGLGDWGQIKEKSESPGPWASCPAEENHGSSFSSWNPLKPWKHQFHLEPN